MPTRQQAIPETAITAWKRLRADLHATLGDDLVAMWAHGGTIGSTTWRNADLDTYVVLRKAPDAETARAIEGAEDTIGADLGVDWDSWYITLAAAGRAEAPRHAFREDRRDTSWAINRAHWLAGRVVNLQGPQPEDVVPAPAWSEIEVELDRELEHLEAHMAAGDTDPYEATYAVLNGSRILHALETREVAISKREAGSWALEHLPDRWHPLLRAALQNYAGEGTPDGAALLAEGMAPFVGMVRERLPAGTDRDSESAPRFSGY
jgi:hypothetical protein